MSHKSTRPLSSREDEDEVRAFSDGKPTRLAVHRRGVPTPHSGKMLPANANSEAYIESLRAATSSSWTRPYEAFDILLRQRASLLAVNGMSLDVGYSARRMAMSTENQLQLLAMLEKHGFKLVARDMSPPWRDAPLFDRTTWFGPCGVMMLNALSGEDIGIDLAISADTAIITEFITWWEDKAVVQHQRDDDSKGRVSGFFAGQNGPCIRYFRAGIGHPFDPLNYSREVCAFFKDLTVELSTPTPRGRLAILDGRPGMGKTYLLRGLVQELHERVSFTYIPASMVPQLDGPGMLSVVEEERYTRDARPRVLIIEDADECLVSRSADNISAIRSLLNFCDGFLGTMLDIRVLATTNSGHIGRTDKIDAALLRPGRLISRATLTHLPDDQVIAWLASRGIHVTEAPKTESGAGLSLAELYAWARFKGVSADG